MNPRHIQLIIPSNNNLQFLVPSQQSAAAQPVRIVVPKQIRLVNPPPTVANLSQEQSLGKIDSVQCSSPRPLNSQSETSQEAASCITSTVVSQMSPVSFLTTDVTSKEKIEQIKSTNNTDKSPSTNANKCNEKRSMSMMENDDCSSKKNKRGKNWSEEETSIFISIWSEYYDQLMSGGSRNSPIYQAMAQQLNQLFSPRTMNGADVKAKIFNLVAEYRKKKKEQGKTGGSPSTWRYFDSIDKILGARPYNDDSLMSDSMNVQQDELINIEIDQNHDLKTQASVEEIVQTSFSNKDIEDRMKENSIVNSNSPSISSCTEKGTSPKTSDSTLKRNSSKKKKISDMRMDLMQQLLVKIDTANEMANQAESKAFVLLEKQTKLQEESLNNEKEFLNVFRSIANNFNSTH